MRARPSRGRRKDTPMTADGAIHVVLLVIAVVVVLYLCAALIFPERF